MSEGEKKKRKVRIVYVGLALLIAALIGVGMVALERWNWQTIELENVSSFQVPRDWVFTEKDGTIVN